MKGKIFFFFIFLKKDPMYLLLESGEGRRKMERNISVPEMHESLASHTPPTGDLLLNPGMCPDCQ